jgi:putative hydrolase of HD superfamily
MRSCRVWLQVIQAIGSATPYEVVQAQVDAYNAHDLEALAAIYHPDAPVHDLALSQTLTAPAQLRPVWHERYTTHPAHQAEIVHRLVVGDFVVDQDHIVGLADGSTLDALVLYRVGDGQIAECWMAY